MLISVLRTILSGGSVSLTDVIAQILSVLFVVFCILPFHELAHAWVANKLGDPTAKLEGRLTFNPLASIDSRGAMWLLLVGFGWAKPVPVDPRYFKKPKQGMAITALAGPIANLLAALVGALIYVPLVLFAPGFGIIRFLLTALSYYIVVNVSLAVFNLIPIPPLDGSRILGGFLSDRALQKYYSYQNILSMVLMLLLVTGSLSGPLSTVQSFFLNAILKLASLPFSAFLG